MNVKEHFKTAGYVVAFTGGIVGSALVAHVVVRACVHTAFDGYQAAFGEKELPTSDSNPNYPPP